jgi:hypothetical protein
MLKVLLVKRLNRLGAILLCFFILGCTSLKKKADENLRAGSFEQAAILYEEVLQKNPNDAEARKGLTSARDGVLDQQLIQVRMARLAGNQQQAIQLLLDVIQKETRWNHTPRTNVAFTQSEESDFAVQFLRGKVRSVLEARFPLRAEHLLLEHRPLFQGEESRRNFDSLKKEILLRGRESCEGFKKGEVTRAPYFADFINRFCSHFQVTCEKCGDWGQKKYQDLYQKIDVSGEVSQVSPELFGLMQQEIQKGFQESPWYDPRGSKATLVQLKGNYQFTHQKNLVSLVHSYSENEPYETIEDVYKTRPVYYTDYEYRTNLKTGQTDRVPVEKSRTESYYEPQRVIRYRKVSKSYPYSALKHEQKLDLSVDGSYDLQGRTLHLGVQKTSNQESMEHHLDIPKIGLRPATPNLIESSKWLKETAGQFRNQMRDVSTEDWTRQYCRVSSDDPSALQNQVHKCLRAKQSSIPGFVNEWYETQLGVDYRAAEALMAQSL